MTTHSSGLEDIHDAASAAALAAAQVIRRLFGRAPARHKSSHVDLVTEADLEAQGIIQAHLSAVVPAAAFFGEEGARTGAEREVLLGAPSLWVVDPLDGTNNYAHGIPHVSVCIAYAEHGVVRYGLVLDVLRDEIFCARAGGGATRNGEPLRVSGAADLKRVIFATGFPYERGELMTRTLTSIERLLRAGAIDVRRTGSAALDACWVACGRLGAYFEYRLNPWDFAAAGLIAAEAGATVSDCDGAPLSLHSAGIACATPMVHAELLRHLIPSVL